MGRSIPSVTARIDAKLADWRRFARLLNRDEQKIFEELTNAIRNRRNAVDAADEADIGIAMLLAAIIHLSRRLDERTGDALRNNENRQSGL